MSRADRAIPTTAASNPTANDEAAGPQHGARVIAFTDRDDRSARFAVLADMVCHRLGTH
jgi:hypothetical protein